MLKELTRIKKKDYDVTIFQTPEFRQTQGYRQVYRLTVRALNQEECLYEVFSTFNVQDKVPTDFRGRYISTGDILLIDEGLRGKYYFQLKPGGWKQINRINIR